MLLKYLDTEKSTLSYIFSSVPIK
ncbi:CLUMA_CG009753, isoform A [Clunio marinus]|uniref:CLUMA_CG009753, isoform A n=1 Tax=Clunio marinus TaxID=568069 RepID=A0A1J1IBH6_9DIPT|nr:CLUMA_CG009753, isoform A [Clunio marinus]